MKDQKALVGLMCMLVLWVGISCVLFVGGCQTLGLSPSGDDPDAAQEQAALEGAAIAGMFHYLKLPDDTPDSEKLQSTLATANEFIATMYPQYGSFPALLQKRIKDVSNDKFNPQVATIYFLLKEILEVTEE